MVKGAPSHFYSDVVCGIVLPTSIVRVPRPVFRLYKPVSFRCDGTTFVLWNSATLFFTHARFWGSDVIPCVGRVCDRSLVLDESHLSDTTVRLPRNVFALSQTVCK